MAQRRAPNRKRVAWALVFPGFNFEGRVRPTAGFVTAPAVVAPGRDSMTILGHPAGLFLLFLVEKSGPIPFDPGADRIFVRIRDTGGITRGAMSVAVVTQ